MARRAATFTAVTTTLPTVTMAAPAQADPDIAAVRILQFQQTAATAAIAERLPFPGIEFGERVDLIEIDNAGHALLPEQPELVANNVLAFLRRHHPA